MFRLLPNEKCTKATPRPYFSARRSLLLCVSCLRLFINFPARTRKLCDGQFSWEEARFLSSCDSKRQTGRRGLFFSCRDLTASCQVSLFSCGRESDLKASFCVCEPEKPKLLRLFARLLLIKEGKYLSRELGSWPLRLLRD